MPGLVALESIHLLDPTSDLAFSTTYTATLKGGTADPRVKDLAGKALADSFSWSFTTATPDTTPPTINSVSATTATQVKVVFSEPVEETSATAVANYSIDNGSIPISSASLGTEA